jgi:hypothetical protein
LYADEIEDDEKELEHSSLQEKLDMELKELDKKLEQKEVRIIIFCVILSLLTRFTRMFQFYFILLKEPVCSNLRRLNCQ